MAVSRRAAARGSRGLARVSRQASAAAAGAGRSAASRPVGLLDALFKYVSGALGCAPCSHAPFHRLTPSGERLPTIPGEKCVSAAALAVAVAALALAAPGSGLALDGTARGEPPIVRSVSFQVASPYLISYEELSGLVTLRPGDRLTPEAVRASIRGLYAKSVFRTVSAFAREEGGQADIRFYLRPVPAIAEIEVTGQKRLSAAQIVVASRLRRGATLEDRDYAAAGNAVLAELRKRGLTNATVSLSVLCNVENGGGKVKIDVNEGAPPTVQSVDLPGGAFFPPEKIRDLLGIKAGDSFDYRRWQEGINAVRRAYKKAGFLTVHITDPELACREGNGVCPSARVEEGGRFDVRWEGAARFKVRDLEEASGIYGDEESTEGGIALDLRERLLAFYRSRDYFRADVTVEMGEKDGGARPLRILLSEGKRGYLKEIRFEGNASIPAARLRKQMISEKRGFFHVLTGSGKFREDEWNADLAAVIGLYQKEGYARARIASVTSDWDDSGGITETIRIEEGARFRIREIAFQGNDHFLKPELLSPIGNREGRYVDYAGIDRDQEAIAAHYRNRGYLDAKVESGLSFDEANGTVVVRFDIVEGPRYRRGNVVVRGTLLTDPVVVLREVTIPPAAPAGEDQLLKFQQAVFGTGLYKTVRIQRVKRPQEGIVDLIVEVEETLFFEVEFGGGYGTDTGLRGFVGAKNRNLDGKGRRLSAQAKASRIEQTILADLREPWVLGNRWKWEGGLTASYSDSQNKSFSLRKSSVITSINKTIFERSSFSFQYEYSRNKPYNVAAGAVLSPEDKEESNIGALRVLSVLDLRDDPFNPRSGSLNSLSAEVASAFLASEVSYYEITGQTSWYFPVFRRTTFVVSGRGGYAHPYGDTIAVPIQKRFFLGGRTTVRGFSEQSIGPHGADGSAIGGDYMVNGNVELRIPLQYGFILATFLDAGTAWLPGNVAGQEFDLREGAGLGLRYVTPVGPISLDYGWKLDRRAGESPSEWHFTIGAVF